MSWLTIIREIGGAAVAGSANAARNAINGIPNSHHTTITEAGAGAVASAASAAANAVNAIPSFKNVAIQITVSGLDAANAALAAVGKKAVGGYVNTGLTQMAEQGAELLRLPNGSFAIAPSNGIYAVPKGTFVYTASQTREMMKAVQNIKGYANGGYVGGAGAGFSKSGPTYIDKREINVTLDAKTAEDFKTFNNFLSNLDRDFEIVTGGSN